MLIKCDQLAEKRQKSKFSLSISPSLCPWGKSHLCLISTHFSLLQSESSHLEGVCRTFLGHGMGLGWNTLLHVKNWQVWFGPSSNPNGPENKNDEGTDMEKEQKKVKREAKSLRSKGQHCSMVLLM